MHMQGLPVGFISEPEAPFTQRENADISTWFGFSFNSKVAKVEISDNAGYVH